MDPKTLERYHALLALTLDELKQIARRLKLPIGRKKQQLAERIAIAETARLVCKSARYREVTIEAARLMASEVPEFGGEVTRVMRTALERLVEPYEQRLRMERSKVEEVPA